MNEYLKPFDSGRSIQSQLTVRRLDDMQRSIPKVRFSGNGVKINNIGGQTFIQAYRPIRNSSTFNFPFQVTTRINPDDPSLFQASVYWNSSLQKSLVLNDRQTITGLANAPKNAPIPSDGNPNWFPLLGNDLIWIEIAMLTTWGIIDSATIANYGLGSDPTWTPSNKPSTTDGPFIYTKTVDGSGNNIFKQTRIRVPIAYTLAGPTGAPIPYQLLNMNLLFDNVRLYNGDTDSDGTIVCSQYLPIPWSAPYIS